jgi:hypothetical protein
MAAPEIAQPFLFPIVTAAQPGRYLPDDGLFEITHIDFWRRREYNEPEAKKAESAYRSPEGQGSEIGALPS